MKTFKKWALRFGLAALTSLALVVPLGAQGALSNQVLQLLTRSNSWTNTNVFADLRMQNPCAAVPVTTTSRIYTDASCNLYFNGTLIAGAGGVTNPHNLLSTTHPDTLAAAAARGAIIVGNSTPAWARVTIGANHTVLVSNGTDAAWGTDGSGLTGLVAANLTGALPAIDGTSLTGLNATNLTSGTVPLARLTNIANAQIAAAAGIAYSKLTLSGSIVNADISASALIAYSKLNLSLSIQNADLANATILFAKLAQNGASNNQVILWNGAAWAATTISQSICTGCGTVTSAALSMPAIFSVAGSPITTSGTFAVTAANETANTVWAGPNTGAAAAPTFRALVNADLPTSGATAGTFPWVTVNAQGVVTATSATIATGTVTASTPLTTTQTWNNAGVNFTAWLLNVTNTNSGAASILADFQLGGATKVNFDKSGDITAAGGLAPLGSTASTTVGLTVGLTSGAKVVASTQTASETSGVSIVDLATTWNNAGNTPTAIKLNVTDTASNAASLLMDLQVGAVSKWKVDKAGNVTVAGTGTFTGLLTANAGATIAASQSLTVTTQDKLTVGGNIIPNTRVIYCEGLDVNTLSGDCNFIIDRAYQVTSIKMNQVSQGGGGCVFDVEKLTGTTAPGAGTVLGTASYDCQTTANNTVTTYTLTGVTATLQFAAGDRIGIKTGGTLTGLRGGSVLIVLKSI